MWSVWFPSFYMTEFFNLVLLCFLSPYTLFVFTTLSSAASFTSEALNVLQSLVTAGLQQEVCLWKEQNFNTSVMTLVYIKSLSLQDQYSLLKELNITLNQFQVSVLDIQSDIVDYLQQKKLWQRYINKRTFLKTWNNTLEKTRKHQSQQNKIRMIIAII